MGENLAYGLRGVEVKEVSHGTTNAIKHNPYAKTITASVMQKRQDVNFFFKMGFSSIAMSTSSKILIYVQDKVA